MMRSNLIGRTATLAALALAGLRSSHAWAQASFAETFDNVGSVNAGSVAPSAPVLVDAAAYMGQFPSCNLLNADLTGDGRLNGEGVQAFVSAVLGG